MTSAAGTASSSAATTTMSLALSDPMDNLSSATNLGGSGGGGGVASTMHSWWESISKARSRILDLASILSSPDLSLLADSDRPARSLLDSHAAFDAISAALSAASSGSGGDALCQWLYDTLQSSDPDLRLVALSFVPLLAGLYLSRVVSSSTIEVNPPSLAGFEVVLLALYAAEFKSRAGKPVLVSTPDLSLPSLYHSPRPSAPSLPPPSAGAQASFGVVSPPLEPQIAVKSTRRACIVAVALDYYYKSISSMPSRSKIDLCEFVADWAGQDCSCRFELDDDPSPSSLQFSPSSSSSSSSSQVRMSSEDNVGVRGTSEVIRSLQISNGPNGNHCNGEGQGGRVTRRGARVPLPWELLRSVLRNLGHCLLAPLNPREVKDSASIAVRCVYARALHDVLPQAILASRSLIQLDKSAGKTSKPDNVSGSVSKPNTPSQPRKPAVLLASN